MNKITHYLQRAVQAMVDRNDLALAALIVAVIFMMILPLPTWLVDVLIAVNMCIVGHPADGGDVPAESRWRSRRFPSVLLITTLFRLALNITTTRLILLHGDAGHIIDTFGNFVVGGNLVVGLVVFLIITIVQFIVITKGAERVAEVAARFTLDAMPGKQMCIDADMRAGVIDMDEAQAPARLVEKESQLYGAMDGAMKFVKGDAIAGLIIVAVNLLGGIAHRHAAARHGRRRGAADLLDPHHRRRPGLADPGAVHLDLRRHDRHPRDTDEGGPPTSAATSARSCCRSRRRLLIGTA